MTIAELLKMSVGQKIGGIGVLTVKKTKKSVRLPDKRYIHTVVLFDRTGDMLADFRDPSPMGYNPIGKGRQVAIEVAEIQAADSIGRSKVDQTGKKLFVHQYSIPTMSIDEYEQGLSEEEERWDKINRGKVRHGLCCAFIRSNTANPLDIKKQINELVDYIMTGE